MRLNGEHICSLLFKLQFILGKIVQRFYVPSRIRPSDHRNSCFMQLGSSSRIRKKLQVFQLDRLAAADVAKDNLAYWQGSSVRDCKTVSFLLQCCVWAASVKIPSEHGERRLIGFWNYVHLEKWIESTGSRWSSSGRFSQDSLH